MFKIYIREYGHLMLLSIHAGYLIFRSHLERIFITLFKLTPNRLEKSDRLYYKMRDLSEKMEAQLAVLEFLDIFKKMKTPTK